MHPLSSEFSLFLTQVRSVAGKGKCVRVSGGGRCAVTVNEVNGNNTLVSGG